MPASQNTNGPAQKEKLVVLGGGCGAMSSIFELTNDPTWKERYESITLYQMGWRLGGKGASGRGPDGRIEEHGLHIWPGFYNNAFGVIQRAYTEMGRPAGTPLATWTDAFKPHSYICLGQQFKDEWTSWPFLFPTNDSVPGKGTTLPTLWDYLKMTLDWIHEIFHESSLVHHQQTQTDHPDHMSALQVLVEKAKQMVVSLELGGETLAEELLAHIRNHLAQMEGDVAQHRATDHNLLLRLVEYLVKWLQREIRHLIEDDIELQRLYILLELGTIGVAGLLRDGVLTHDNGLGALDNEDLREWYKRHCASDVAVDSPPLQGLYDLVFAFQNGEADKPNFAAGTAFLCIFRICLTYKGAIFWKMQAGMGDTIFTPLYDVLKKRGVTFKFFHRVQNLGLSADKTSIETISIAQQATLKDRSNDATYQPFVTVQDLECWPANPNYDQLTEGEALRAEGVNLESFYTTWKDVGEITLKAGQDFDRVIFGIALGSIPFVCSELLAANKEWKLMAENVETVRTMAYQAWLKRDLKGLGWENQSPVLDAYVDPLNTWADMSQLIVREDFDDVKNIAYFCGPMVGGIPPQPDQSLPAISKDFVEAEGKKWMNDASKNLWPLAFNEAGEFDWSIVKGHFARANIDPTERYVLSVKGSAVFRIRTDKTGFSNLLIAGDWTENPINAGCVEAAVMSGMMAANVLSGKDIYDGIQETGE